MKSSSILGAIGGGVIGALIWAAVSYFLNVEIGYIAWGIGFIVGFGSAKLGGFGTTNGALCAGVAILSILVGKALAVKFHLDKEVGSVKAVVYESAIHTADEFAKIETEDEYPGFMVEHEYCEAEDETEVTDEDLAYFKENSVPALRRAKDQTFSEWEDDFDEEMSGMMDELISAGVKESIGLFDILFGILGIVTAFKLGSGSSDEK